MRKKQQKKKKKQRRKERSPGSCWEGQGKRREERERLVTRPEKRRHRENADSPRSPREARAKTERSRRLEGGNEPPGSSRKSRRRASNETRSSGSRPASASRRGSESTARNLEEQSKEPVRRTAVPEEPRKNSNKELRPEGGLAMLRKRRSSREEEASPGSKRRPNPDRSHDGLHKQSSEQPDRKQTEKPESWTMKPGAADKVQKPPALAETKSFRSAGPEVLGADRRRETKRGPLTVPSAAPRVAFKIPKQGSAVRARPGWDGGPGSRRPPAGTADPQSAAFDRGETGPRPAAVPSHFSTQQKSSGSREALSEPSSQPNKSSRSASAEHASCSSPTGKRAEAADQEVQLVEKLYLARSSKQLQLNMVESYGELTCMDVDPPEEGATITMSQQQRQQDLLIVLDTNVLLSHLDFVKKIRSHGLGALGFPTLLVPWVVLQELDTLKSGKLSKEVERQARPAVDYIYICLKNQEPRLRGQSMQQASQVARGTNAANNDDRVLQCCLQYQELHPKGAIILCTNDKNLCSKALLSGVTALSKADLTEQVEINPGFLNHCNNAPAAYPHLTAAEKGWQADGVKQPGEEEEASRRKAAETEQELSECVSVLESSLHAVLSAVLEEEMSAVFGELWTEIVYVKPPWTLAGVLQCFRKHWIAVFGTIIRRSLLRNVEMLSNFLCTDTSVDRSSVLKAVCAAEELLSALCSRSSYSGRINSSLSCIKALKHRLQAEPQKAPVEDGSDGDALMEAVDVAPPPASYQAVWDLFQNIWNNVCHVSLALFSAFNFSPDSAGPVQPFSAPPPQDALGCLYRLSAAVGQLLEAFHRLLSVNSSVEDAQALLSFLHASAILPVQPSFSAKDLFECLSQEEYRDKLSVGGSQLMDLKSNLDRCAAAACGQNPSCT